MVCEFVYAFGARLSKLECACLMRKICLLFFLMARSRFFDSQLMWVLSDLLILRLYAYLLCGLA